MELIISKFLLMIKTKITFFTASTNYLGTNFWVCIRSEQTYGWWWNCDGMTIPTNKNNIWFDGGKTKNFKMYLTTH